MASSLRKPGLAQSGRNSDEPSVPDDGKDKSQIPRSALSGLGLVAHVGWTGALILRFVLSSRVTTCTVFWGRVATFDGWVRDGSLPVKLLEVVCASERVPVLLPKMTE